MKIAKGYITIFPVIAEYCAWNGMCILWVQVPTTTWHSHRMWLSRSYCHW